MDGPTLTQRSSLILALNQWRAYADKDRASWGPIETGDDDEAGLYARCRNAIDSPASCDDLARAMHQIGLGCMRPVALSRDLCGPGGKLFEDHLGTARLLIAKIAEHATVSPRPASGAEPAK